MPPGECPELRRAKGVTGRRARGAGRRRPEAIGVARLHDVVEETAPTLDDVCAGEFGEDVAAAVEAMTRHPDAGDEYYRKLAADDLAIVVKLADIWDNTDPDRGAVSTNRIGPRCRASTGMRWR
jgi:hypothetical protein